MSDQPNRLAADAAHGFGGIGIDRSKPLSFKLNGHRIDGFDGDTVLTAAMASGIDSAGLDGTSPLALDERFCPPVLPARGPRDAAAMLPMDRTPAIDGLDLVSVGKGGNEARAGRILRRAVTSLGHRYENDPLTLPWTRLPPVETVMADIAIVGGGVAGLAAAEAAAAAGRKVVLIERRPWLGGDARYFGPLGNDETPEALIARLSASLAASANVTVMTATDAFDISGGAVIAHRVEVRDGKPVGRVVEIVAAHIIVATGCLQRLPVFAGNRLPGVVASVAAYHRAKRSGVWRGRHGLFATQSNFAYRLALRIHDAGVGIGRIVDARLNPQSRFVDFSKASGFTLSSSLVPVAALSEADGSMTLRIRGEGGAEQSISIPSGQIVLSGAWQPDLSLWMRAGGAIRWDGDPGRLETTGTVEHLVLAGSVAGVATTKGVVASGRAAVATLLGKTPVAVDDTRIDSNFETPDALTPIAPPGTGMAYLDSGASLIARHAPESAESKAVRWSPVHDSKPLGLGDVAASVQARLIEPGDAGIIAEERGTAGGAIAAATWGPERPVSSPAIPVYLEGRFGPNPVRAVVTVDNRRKFATGALIYANTAAEFPPEAVGVVIGPAPAGRNGGVALLSRAQLERIDRFVIRTAHGPAPLRIAERLDEAATPAG